MQEKKYNYDLIWNYVSLAIMACGGVLFSTIIGVFYTPDVLGRFNTVYAYYIVLSQICVCGIHVAVTKYSAQYEKNNREQTAILNAGMLLVVIISLITVLFASVIANLFMNGFFSENMLISLNNIWLALIFFSINKVFLGYLNGKLFMKGYAFFQGIRNIIIAVCIVILSVLRFDGNTITICFFCAELILFICEIVYLYIKKELKMVFSKKWVKELFLFGVRIMPANIVLELNTKVDIICMSILAVNEELIGIYSFAVLFAEGFYQVFVVLRRMINPKITQAYHNNMIKDYLDEMKTKYSNIIAIFATVCGVGVVVVQYVLTLFFEDGNYWIGTIAIIVICISIIATHRSIILGNILSQSGFPSEESVVNILTVSTNLCLNMIFIKIGGVLGAAIATAISYIVFSKVQKKIVKKALGVQL